MHLYGDIVFINGNIITVNEKNEILEALAIKGDRITFVGSNDEIKKYIGEKTEIIDLKGRSLLPGFIDSHVHMAVYGMNALGIDCRYPKVKSIEDIKGLIKEETKKIPEGKWIRCWGYDHSKLTEKRHPTRWDLDQVSPNNPVILTRTCAHISTHNSKSMELAGIDENTKSPPGGEIEKKEGIPTGVMKENAHMNVLKISKFSKEELIKGLKRANEDFIRQGITSLHDSGGYGAVQMAAMQEAIQKKVVDIRIYSMIFSFVENLNFINDFIKVGIHTNFGDQNLKLGPIKIMTDGSSSGPTAATNAPYSNGSGSRGIMSMTKEEIEENIFKAHAAGYQVTAHAVGDRAIEQVITAIEKALKVMPKKNHRHRIEHCAIVNENIISKIKQLGIIPIPQPTFLYEFGDGYMVNFGGKRVDKMFPCKTFIQNNIICAGSSDCPITFINPLLGIHMAVNRVTQTGQKISQNEKISVEEAIRMYTYNGAYASFDENIKGSLELGKLADLVVLSENILKCNPKKIKEIVVDMTMIGGKVIR